MFSWLKKRRIIRSYDDRKAIPTEKRGRLLAEKLDAEFAANGELISAEKIIESLNNLYFLAMMHDGTLFKHSRNDGEADMLMEAFLILKYFAANHKHYVCPLPGQRTELAGKP